MRDLQWDATMVPGVQCFTLVFLWVLNEYGADSVRLQQRCKNFESYQNIQTGCGVDAELHKLFAAGLFFTDAACRLS